MKFGKILKDTNGLYQISNCGRVKTLKKKIDDYRGEKTRTINEKILSPFDNGHGYLTISLVKDKKRKNYYIHRLVAVAFLDNLENKKYINHLDYNTKNNNVSNLQWCSQKENIGYSKEKMKHRKSITHTNTGEKYIYYRAKYNSYRIVIDKKEYKSCKTLEEAIKKRDEILKNE